MFINPSKTLSMQNFHHERQSHQHLTSHVGSTHLGIFFFPFRQNELDYCSCSRRLLPALVLYIISINDFWARIFTSFMGIDYICVHKKDQLFVAFSYFHSVAHLSSCLLDVSFILVFVSQLCSIYHWDYGVYRLQIADIEPIKSITA